MVAAGAKFMPCTDDYPSADLFLSAWFLLVLVGDNPDLCPVLLIRTGYASKHTQKAEKARDSDTNSCPWPPFQAWELENPAS
jgi:hypothetical protein